MQTSVPQLSLIQLVPTLCGRCRLAGRPWLEPEAFDCLYGQGVHGIDRLEPRVPCDAHARNHETVTASHPKPYSSDSQLLHRCTASTCALALQHTQTRCEAGVTWLGYGRRTHERQPCDPKEGVEDVRHVVGPVGDAALLCVLARQNELLHPQPTPSWLSPSASASGQRTQSRVSVSSSAGGEPQSVATPQAARGWARPPCRHFKLQSCARLGSAFEVPRW
jgi:hypothetical protein